jgi:hypothetical protein
VNCVWTNDDQTEYCLRSSESQSLTMVAAARQLLDTICGIEFMMYDAELGVLIWGRGAHFAGAKSWSHSGHRGPGLPVHLVVRSYRLLRHDNTLAAEIMCSYALLYVLELK